ncbi:hypothetical protein F5879DRAFT_560082 [Lentinula edodes]|nr:hypothetical protein F5879DRAFT_560082 [Lentinula edodes]
MCYPEGSVSHAVNDCPLCKAFVHSRCPHVREVCRNRALHPQLDVVYLKNAEGILCVATLLSSSLIRAPPQTVDWFNGCGYCKWARLNPSQKPGFPNPGWPGCCRAPAPSEYRMIQAADWRSISIVHHIPIPPEIKVILDGLTTGGRSSSKPFMPPLDRRNSNSGTGTGTGGGSPPTKLGNTAVKPVSSANKVRTSASPKTPAATLSKATANAVEGIRNSPEKEKASYNNSAHSSPGRKQIELDTNTTPRRNSGSRAPPAIPSFNKGSPDLRSSTLPSGKSSLESRSSAIPSNKGSPDLRPSVIPSGKSSPESRSSAIPSNKGSPDLRPSVIPSGKGSPESRSPATTLNKGSPESRSSVVPLSKGSPEMRPSLDRRRSSNIHPPTPSSKSSIPSRNTASSFTLASRKASKNDDASSVASGGSGGSDSLSDSTITSDGGFTDYLSDESEAELQRQAEAKAALLAQNQAEELEFKAARQQLAHVDLRPPKSWNPTNITNNNTALRLTTTTKG